MGVELLLCDTAPLSCFVYLRACAGRCDRLRFLYVGLAITHGDVALGRVRLWPSTCVAVAVLIHVQAGRRIVCATGDAAHQRHHVSP